MPKKTIPHTFVYFYNGNSNWEQKEIRYSIRSVCKYHNDPKICVIGTKPKFYNGDFIEFQENPNTPYVNQFRKALLLCHSPEISDPFIKMDDDFFLQAPLQFQNYRLNNLIREKAMKNQGWEPWKVAVRETARILPAASPNYLSHTPLFIHKEHFLSAVRKWKRNWETPPGLLLRQTYLTHIQDKGVIKIKTLEKDVKISLTEDIKRCPQFFSTRDNLQGSDLGRRIEKLYPTPSKWENDI